MRYVCPIRILIFSFFITLPIVALSIAEERTEAGNVYASGRDVRVDVPVSADLYAAGKLQMR